MSFPNIDPDQYVRYRAEQLAIETDSDTFMQLYLARSVAFRTDDAPFAAAKFDEFISPFRKQAHREFLDATTLAKNAYVSILEAELLKAKSAASQDGKGILTPDEIAQMAAVEKALGL